MQGRVFVLYVQMENGRDTSTWLSVAKVSINSIIQSIQFNYSP